MKHIWSVLCQNSSVDIESNLLSLFNCVEEISLIIDPTKAPKNDKIVFPIKFQIVSFWIVEDTNKDDVLEIKIDLLDPDKELLNHFEKNFNIKKNILRFRSRINIEGMPVTKEGRYTFKVWKRKSGKKEYEVVTEVPLDIKIAYKLDINKR